MTVPWINDFPVPQAPGTAWQYSTNAGATWGPVPTGNPNEVPGPTGQQRYRQNFTVPAGPAQVLTATVGGDTWDGSQSIPGRVVLDGADQGLITPLIGGPPWAGPARFTLLVPPGPHTIELWMGQADGATPSTAPTATFATQDFQPCQCWIQGPTGAVA
jgi:hypothetical protein